MFPVIPPPRIGGTKLCYSAVWLMQDAWREDSFLAFRSLLLRGAQSAFPAHEATMGYNGLWYVVICYNILWYTLICHIYQLHSLAHCLPVSRSSQSRPSHWTDTFPHFRCRPLHNQLGVPLILGTDDGSHGRHLTAWRPHAAHTGAEERAPQLWSKGRRLPGLDWNALKWLKDVSLSSLSSLFFRWLSD